jgi:hypothetical protein
VARTPGPISHGSPGGYQTELMRGLETCEACRAANTRASGDRKRKARHKGKCAPGLGWPLLPGAGRG